MSRDPAAAVPAIEERDPQPALDENVQAIRRWEQASLHRRSRTERVSDWVTHAAASGPVLLGHVIWFSFWILANTRQLSRLTPFDPFPFPLLTSIVSLEAIFLTLFVLASQNRLSQQSDKRAHLDLQIDLLAEQELTIMLRLLQEIARDLKVNVSTTPEQIRDLVKKTDLHKLTVKLEKVSDDLKA